MTEPAQPSTRRESFGGAFADLFDLSASDVVPEALLADDLGVDSLGFVEVGALCAEFGVVLSERDLERLVRFGDLLAVIEESGPAQDAS
jgi:acyl carrier protein